MSYLPIVVIFLSVTVVTCALMSLVGRSEWWFRIFDFPRVQIATLGVIVVLLQVISYRGYWYELLLIPVLGAAIVWELSRIIPFTSFYKTEVNSVELSEDSQTISILVSNVLMTNQRTDCLLDLVAEYEPDVLLTLETDQYWEDALASLENTYTYVVRCPQDDLYGMHLYSKFELLNPSVEFLVEQNVPSIHAEVRIPSGQKIKLHCLHPAPPSPTENDTSIERDAELIMVAKQVQQENIPVIVFGDLNDVAWSDSTLLFRKISGLLDPRIGRGLFNSFHAGYWFLRWPLDHVFHSPEFGLIKIGRLHNIGSDHFPIFCQLRLMPNLESAKNPASPNTDEIELANEKLAEARDKSSN
jgi:endonuclease/exonuclease/phosphatase (EEP) superfamily protein YafD